MTRRTRVQNNKVKTRRTLNSSNIIAELSLESSDVNCVMYFTRRLSLTSSNWQPSSCFYSHSVLSTLHQSSSSFVIIPPQFLQGSKGSSLNSTPPLPRLPTFLVAASVPCLHVNAESAGFQHREENREIKSLKHVALNAAGLALQSF